MLDETIITETPPLYACYGHIGEQVRVPITGNRAKRILHGAETGRSDVTCSARGHAILSNSDGGRNVRRWTSE